MQDFPFVVRIEHPEYGIADFIRGVPQDFLDGAQQRVPCVSRSGLAEQ